MNFTRTMDHKFLEADGFGEEVSGKKKSKFKSIKKFFGKKRRKETLASSGSGDINTCQSATDVMVKQSRHIDYDSEDDLETHRTIMGNRALSHDSIFISETTQEPSRPVRVLSQENVSDRIRALQVKLEQNWKLGLSPPFGTPSKRLEDAGMSSEDDGLPRSPPETYLLHDILNPSTSKFPDSHKCHSSLSLAGTGSEEEEQVTITPSRSYSTESQLSSHQSRAKISEISPLPPADFNALPEFSSCLDNSAAKHKLSVKPRNQRSSRIRRPTLRKLSESQNSLICTPEEDESAEKEVLVEVVDKDVTCNQKEMTDSLSSCSVVSSQKPVTSRRVQRRLNQPDEKPCRPPSISNIDPLSCENYSESCQAAQGSQAITQSSASEPKENVVTPKHEQKHYKVLEMSPSVPVNISNQESNQIFDIPSKVVLKTAKNISAKHDMTAELDGSGKKPLKDVKEFLENISSRESIEGSSLLPSSINFLSSNLSQVPDNSICQTSCRSSSSKERRCSLTQDKIKTDQEKPDSNEESHLPAASDGVLGEKAENEAKDLCALRKFSVSSARWRSRSNNTNLKETSEGEKPLAMQTLQTKTSFSLSSETAKVDMEMNSSQEKIRPINKQKSLLQLESGIPSRALDSMNIVSEISGSKSVVSSSSSNHQQLSAPDHSSYGSKNPFQVKLRSTPLSWKHRDISQESKESKRDSAELNLEKEGLTLSSLKVEKAETRNITDINVTHSLSESFKANPKPSEQGNIKPPLPRKPMLQPFSIIGINTSVEKQEKITKHPEFKNEGRGLEKKQNSSVVPETRGPSAAIAADTDTARTDIQTMPAWITIAKQKQRVVEQEFSKEEKPVGQDKAAVERPIKEKETMEETVRHSPDFPQNTGSLSPFTVFAEETKTEMKLDTQESSLKTSLLSHHNPAQPSLLIEQDVKPLRKISHSPDQPLWMELAKKKSQAWSDMPQRIK